jgi:hypothetical protein
MDTRARFRPFLQQLAARLEAGAAAYGDKSFDKPTPALFSELQQEMLDIAGWGYVLHERVRRLLAAYPPASDTAETRGPDIELTFAMKAMADAMEQHGGAINGSQDSIKTFAYLQHRFGQLQETARKVTVKMGLPTEHRSPPVTPAAVNEAVLEAGFAVEALLRSLLPTPTTARVATAVDALCKLALQLQTPHAGGKDHMAKVLADRSAEKLVRQAEWVGNAKPFGADRDAETRRLDGLRDPVGDRARARVKTITEREGKFCDEMLDELERATNTYGAFRNGHEGYGVILEELDELWDEVKASKGSRYDLRVREEAVQVAAMAMRFALDLCDDPRDAKAER